jgi:hypothetical protein
MEGSVLSVQCADDRDDCAAHPRLGEGAKGFTTSLAARNSLLGHFGGFELGRLDSSANGRGFAATRLALGRETS